MANNKTVATSDSIQDFIAQIPDEQKRKDSDRLIQIMEEITGEPAVLWGPSIIGFGSYHYKYASGHEGNAPLAGFSPRKSAISLYLYICENDIDLDLKKLGKFKMSKACIYVKKLSDIHEDFLIKIIKDSIVAVKIKYG